MIQVKFEAIQPYLAGQAIVPIYKTKWSAGADLSAIMAKPLLVDSGERALIGTGLKLEIPEGYEGQIRTRSGLALDSGLIVLNSPGTIDADYRGEIKVILANVSGKPAIINPGQRIAQIVFAKVERAEFVDSWEGLSETTRGLNGFGSTGNY